MPAVIAKEKTERKFNARMLSRRLDFAKFLLVQTTVPLETIAADCGWKSETAFTNDFQYRVGVTPLHYRNWHQC